MIRVLRALLILTGIFAAGFSWARYDVTPLLTWVKRDKVALLTRLGQAPTTDDESQILRAYLLAKVICETPSTVAEAFCRDIQRTVELNGQTIGGVR